MANPTGKSGPRDKPFRDALRMELAAAGEDHKALRAIARNLISLAQKDDKDALPAINSIADRTDGKVAQAIIGGEEDDNPVQVVTRLEIVGVRSDGSNSTPR